MIRRQALALAAATVVAFATSTALAQGKAAAPAKAAPAPAVAAQTVKIAFIDPLSGPFAGVGTNLLRHFQFMAEMVNAQELAGPGIKFEIVPFDNKASPQESLTVLKQVIDQGIRFVAQGNGSGAALALIDAIEKHNERNPAQSIVFLNYAAVDPDLTNSKCSFWHFRFDANTDMKMEALTTFIKNRPEVKNVFLINQNYSHGQQVSRVAKEQLASKRPDVKIVGDDLHPLGQVRDFSPYIAKMRAANADTVITGNWGPDLALLVRAARDAGLTANFYTYYAGVIGTPTAIGAAGENRVHQVSYWHPNIAPDYPYEKMAQEFKKRFNEEWYTVATYTSLTLLAEGIKRAKSTDPLKVAYAMEGVKLTVPHGDIEMRATDHQLLQPLWISSWTKVGGVNKHDVEKTGYTWKTEAAYPTYVASQPTSCQMKRPARPQ
ncbi:MAG TPA: branched-chain amino acid ABC transporter substrate-binding protein [Burkholderiaceae bacterium]|nr:branched-chain amino acid ABC transporter substrate-binding protein [Burkholderiaceae bacterium]HQR72903.1 branched-chain amino acid ABC transporter substrate-binding protein [Burkholderiaceae bacterium]